MNDYYFIITYHSQDPYGRAPEIKTFRCEISIDPGSKREDVIDEILSMARVPSDAAIMYLSIEPATFHC